MKWYTRRHIENLLRSYKEMYKEYEELRQDILNESPLPPDGMPRGGETSDPTHGKVVRLMSNPRLRNMEVTIRAISNVMACLPPEKVRLIELKYWARPQILTDEGIAIELNCGVATVYRWTNRVIEDVAYELGYVDCSRKMIGK